MGVTLLRLEDSEPLNSRLKKYEVSSEVRKIAKELTEHNKVGFATFHTY